MPAQNSPSGRPEIPPDIPPEFVDAYLAGFQRGYGGEAEPVAPERVEAPEPPAGEGLDEVDRPRVESDDPTDDIDPPTDEIDPPTAQFEQSPEEVDEPGLDEPDRPDLDRPGLNAAGLHRPEPKRPEQSRPNTSRPEDMEWLFERDQDAPLGWAFPPADEDSNADRTRGEGTGGGSTSTATEEARPGSSPTGRSPWVVLVGFLSILVVLMLVAYIGGMAFSTIVNR